MLRFQYEQVDHSRACARMMAVADSEKSMSICMFVSTHVTDRQTDRQTDKSHINIARHDVDVR